MKQLGLKEMEGIKVCQYLFRERWAVVPDDTPVDPTAPKDRRIGDGLKGQEDAWVYVCKSPYKPFKCSATPICVRNEDSCAPDCCTVLYEKLPPI